MRTLVFLLLALVVARGATAIETARGLAAAGAPHLALTRVETLQPRDPGAAHWPEWEALRLRLLADVGRNDEALHRAAQLPAGMPQPLLRQCLMAAARAGIGAGRGSTARRYAARLLWQLEPGAEDVREARLLVIDSFLAEAERAPAYRAMLRFDQDYRPLSRETANRFVESLLDLGMAKEAVNWLASLDDAGALKLRLRLDAGLADPAQAAAQARSALGKGGGSGFWRVLADAAAKLENGALRIEALEKLLQERRHQPAGRSAGLAKSLWEAYETEARAAANRAHLLAGQETAWYDLAVRALGTRPFEARALFAHVARGGAAGETRHSAELQLVFSLRQDGLDLAALNLYRGVNPDVLDARSRFLLGDSAESQRLPALAVRWWRGLATPPGTDETDWLLRVNAARWRAGEAEEALADVRKALVRDGALSPEAQARVMALAKEMRNAGAAGSAESVLAPLLPRVEPDKRRDLLSTLGEIAESAGHYSAAAGYYLQAALSGAVTPPDAVSVRARFAAAANLARAGFRDDARAQYQWLIQHAQDAAQREAASRELARL